VITAFVVSLVASRAAATRRRGRNASDRTAPFTSIVARTLLGAAHAPPFASPMHTARRGGLVTVMP
jgi:hypothetical protein